MNQPEDPWADPGYRPDLAPAMSNGFYRAIGDYCRRENLKAAGIGAGLADAMGTGPGSLIRAREPEPDMRPYRDAAAGHARQAQATGTSQVREPEAGS
jgi:hypothetical protein